jgi:acyl-coenzyme A thioesterase 9
VALGGGARQSAPAARAYGRGELPRRGWMRARTAAAANAQWRRANTSVSGGTEVAGSTKSPVTEQLWLMRQAASAVSGEDCDSLPSPSHLVSKTPADAAVRVAYNFASDHSLRAKYENAWGYVRMGVILEDLDALAGTVAFNHCDDANPATRPLMLVTACVDQITILRPLRMSHDVQLRGQVSWVGRSSMEIRMEVRDRTDADKLVLVAHFTFVAKDRNTGRGAMINTLAPQTDQEQAWFAEAAERAEAKKRARQIPAEEQAVSF